MEFASCNAFIAIRSRRKHPRFVRCTPMTPCPEVRFQLGRPTSLLNRHDPISGLSKESRDRVDDFGRALQLGEVAGEKEYDLGFAHQLGAAQALLVWYGALGSRQEQGRSRHR